MAANFRIPERDQLFLIPPSLQEWIPEDDIVHFVNEKAISSAFLHILKLAKELGILKIGTVSTDGTKIKANASIHKSH